MPDVRQTVRMGGLTMAEYIEREAFKQKYLCCGYLPEMSEKEFDEFPAADVAPVVRCKDCEYLVNATVNANGFLICDISDMEIAPDDYCSYGEPKEG